MNPSLYTLLVQKKFSRAKEIAPVKEIRYRVRRTVNKGVVKFIQSPIIEQEELERAPGYAYDFYG